MDNNNTLQIDINDIGDGRPSDVGANPMDVLMAIQSTQLEILQRVKDNEKQLTLHGDKINKLEGQIVSSEPDSESQARETANGHIGLMDELPNSSAADLTKLDKNTNPDVTKLDVKLDMDYNEVDNGDYSFMAQDSSDKDQDASDKVEKLLRRASVGAASNKLEPFNIQQNVTSSISFEDHQYKHSNKEVNMIANLKYCDYELTKISVVAIYFLLCKVESFVAKNPDAALHTGAMFSDSVKAQMEAYSTLHRPTFDTKYWGQMPFNEAILRARLTAAPFNKGMIIQELQEFRSPFGSTDNISLSPDKLVGVLSRLMIWLKEYERFYYLCTFHDYNKNVYGLEPSQQPLITGNFGLIATMYNHFPPALHTYVRRNFFDIDRNHGDNRYKYFASPFAMKQRQCFMSSFTSWCQSEYIQAVQTQSRLKETMDNKPYRSKCGTAIPGINSFNSMLDRTNSVSFDATNNELDSPFDGELLHVSYDTLNSWLSVMIIRW